MRRYECLWIESTECYTFPRTRTMLLQMNMWYGMMYMWHVTYRAYNIVKLVDKLTRKLTILKFYSAASPSSCWQQHFVLKNLPAWSFATRQIFLKPHCRMPSFLVGSWHRTRMEWISPVTRQKYRTTVQCVWSRLQKAWLTCITA